MRRIPGRKGEVCDVNLRAKDAPNLRKGRPHYIYVDAGWNESHVLRKSQQTFPSE